jgi:hypothetical protein
MAIIRSNPLKAALVLSLAVAPTACGDAPDDLATAPLEISEAPSAQACDLTGTWATKTVVPVTWRQTLIIARGLGQVDQYTMHTRTQTGAAFTDTVQVCGITLPAVRGQPVFGGELYRARFEPSVFDTEPIGTSTVNGTLTAAEVDATYSIPRMAVLVGLTMNRPLTDPWPADPTNTGATLGPDGALGVKATMVTDAGYSLPPINLLMSRAKSLQMVLRSVGSSTGKLETCDRLTGTAAIADLYGVSAINSHIVGCTRTDNVPCTPRELRFIDAQTPVLSAGGAGRVVSVRLRPGATCADVRAASF